MKEIKIGNHIVGDKHPCFIVAEIGINHNGDMKIAKDLIDSAADAGCQAVKFQKRTVDIVYTAEELSRPRENPFGPTNGDLKRGLEFGWDEYFEIDGYCRSKNILWFASCWDEKSVDFIDQFKPPLYKIASASLTDDRLLSHIRGKGSPVILSTGMSSMEQIRHAVSILDQDTLILMHCTSTYPAKPNELNLRVLERMKKEFPCLLGYSGHEVGLATTLAARVLGASVIERHVTLDRAMWGSDQAASVEPQGLKRIVKDIRAIEEAMGDGVKRILESEIPIMAKLRRVGGGV